MYVDPEAPFQHINYTVWSGAMLFACNSMSHCYIKSGSVAYDPIDISTDGVASIETSGLINCFTCFEIVVMVMLIVHVDE